MQSFDLEVSLTGQMSNQLMQHFKQIYELQPLIKVIDLPKPDRSLLKKAG